MAKVVFQNGREIPVSFFGIAQLGILYIDCNLPIAEAFQIFSNEENISEFKYVHEVEKSDGSYEEVVNIVREFDIFVGVENIFSMLDDDDPTVRITLKR